MLTLLLTLLNMDADNAVDVDAKLVEDFSFVFASILTLLLMLTLIRTLKWTLIDIDQGQCCRFVDFSFMFASILTLLLMLALILTLKSMLIDVARGQC